MFGEVNAVPSSVLNFCCSDDTHEIAQIVPRCANERCAKTEQPSTSLLSVVRVQNNVRLNRFCYIRVNVCSSLSIVHVCTQVTITFSLKTVN